MNHAGFVIDLLDRHQRRSLRQNRLQRGHVDQAVFQSTYLKDWYTEGFNDIEHNAALLERFPGKLRVNGRWDPRDGEAGLLDGLLQLDRQPLVCSIAANTFTTSAKSVCASVVGTLFGMQPAAVAAAV